MHGVKRPLLLTADTDKAVAGRLNQHNRHKADSLSRLAQRPLLGIQAPPKRIDWMPNYD
jgi:hypothetical protein